jgi:NADH-quinone oxidoreductase subunit C
MSETTVNDDAATDGPATGDGEGESAAPADERRASFLATLSDVLGHQLLDSHIVPGHELWVRVDRAAWLPAVEAAKVRLGCTFFDFLSAIDWLPSPWGRYEDARLAGLDDDGNPTPAATNGTGGGIPYVDPASIKPGFAGGETRFQVMCRVADIRRDISVVFKADLPDDDLRISSLVSLYAGANWHERECWEMFGFTFDGHPGLRHLYLPGAFEGHPLRKDFPLLARLVKPWPGIVDVEPMPEDPTSDEPAAEAEGEATGEAVDAAAEGHAESDADPQATSDAAEADAAEAEEAGES